MSAEVELVVGCVRVSENSNPLPGSIKKPCQLCGIDVWHHPLTTGNALKSHGYDLKDGIFRCLQCIGRIDKFLPLTDEQIEEVKNNL